MWSEVVIVVVVVVVEEGFVDLVRWRWSLLSV
jgi:hypothetical protein